LKSISRYTQKTWGLAQRNRYLTQLDHRFQALAENPPMGRSCEAIRAGYRKFHEGRHVIYYMPIADGIEVVRVLHTSMDVERYL
jgi:toxin ParE1/3/4